MCGGFVDTVMVNVKLFPAEETKRTRQGEREREVEIVLQKTRNAVY